MLLPCHECKGRCCTFPVFSPDEYYAVKAAIGIPEGTIIRPMTWDQCYDKSKRDAQGYTLFLKDGTCPYLKEGACSIYGMRPKVCKDYGNVPDLPCEYLYPKEAKQKQDERVRKSGL